MDVQIIQKSLQTGENIPCGYAISPIWRFDRIDKKHALYRGKDCMKKFLLL